MFSGLTPLRFTGEQIDDDAQEGKDDSRKNYRPPNEEHDDSEDWQGGSGTRAPDGQVGIAPNERAPHNGDHQAGQHCFEVDFECCFRVSSRMIQELPPGTMVLPLTARQALSVSYL